MRIEKIEDKIIVKKIQGAPERKVYYIDTGNLSSKKLWNILRKLKKK